MIYIQLYIYIPTVCGTVSSLNRPVATVSPPRRYRLLDSTHKDLEAATVKLAEGPYRWKYPKFSSSSICIGTPRSWEFGKLHVFEMISDSPPSWICAGLSFYEQISHPRLLAPVSRIFRWTEFLFVLGGYHHNQYDKSHGSFLRWQLLWKLLVERMHWFCSRIELSPAAPSSNTKRAMLRWQYICSLHITYIVFKSTH